MREDDQKNLTLTGLKARKAEETVSKRFNEFNWIDGRIITKVTDKEPKVI